jgi:hypothetical protein
MERTTRAHALRIAVAAGLGLCLSLPLAAQDMTQGTRLGNRTDKASTSGNRVQSSSKGNPSPAGATSRAGDQRFLDKATKANEKEVAAATVAQQKARSPSRRRARSKCATTPCTCCATIRTCWCSSMKPPSPWA